MAGLSLREAAEQAGISKSTVFRAIKAGRLSAERTADGGFAIDPAELFRVFPPGDSVKPVASRPKGQRAMGLSAEEEIELRVRAERAEAQLAALRDMLDGERRRAEDLRAERDRWAAQAERLALPGPETQRRRWWWRAG